MQSFNAEHLQEKWAPLLDAESADPIKDNHKRMVTAVLLENQEKFMAEERGFLAEAPTNSGNAAGASGGFGGSAASASSGGSPTDPPYRS